MNPGKITITSDAEWLRIEFAAEGIEKPGRALFVALHTDPLSGCAVIPYQQHTEGSTVFLPFRASRLYAARIDNEGKPAKWWREWKGTQWSGHMDVKPEFKVEVERGKLRILIPSDKANLPALIGKRVFEQLKRSEWIRQTKKRGLDFWSGERLEYPCFAVWAKDTMPNNGWGNIIREESLHAHGQGDQSITNGFELTYAPFLDKWGKQGWEKTEVPISRVRIYQLLPRLFSNTNETRKPNGTLAENGVGKFDDINTDALQSIKALGATHVWLTGVLSQATSVDYPGKPADDPDLLKGLAGSPYAIKDYGDVCPDYAVEPEKRMEEFKALIERAHGADLRVIIDFVPNHVARSHDSKLVSFGHSDDTTKFFSPQNNFFWLQPDSPGGGAPLRLPTVRDGQFISPTCRVLGKGDGLFGPETTTGRVTGNNASTWSPSQNDWYETVKLNYGFDFTTGKRAYPHAGAPDMPVPDTWTKMDAVLAHWQSLGVDGFRCDMSHMVPPEFWAWAISRARVRQPGVFFIAEAYNNDPMKVEGGYELLAHFHNVMIELLNAGFDAVYDDPAYKTLKHIYDGPAWANDLDGVLAAQGPYVFPGSLRYAENHDEVRLAGKGNWGGIGMEVGRPVSGILFGISRGPVLLYSGQEVGEPADGEEGFGGDDARTTIFDYWSMPEMVKWVNGHRYDGARLSPPQKELRAFYGRLLHTCGEPAFRDGEFFPLNAANKDNAAFGRLGEQASGHWMYAYLRSTPGSAPYLVAANLHRSEGMREVRIQLSAEAQDALSHIDGECVLSDEVGGLPAILTTFGELKTNGVLIPALPHLSVSYFKVSPASK